ncbi:ABC transporter ATP-binding protein [Anaeromyxobacter paludicola]|uniref:ABC transporter ATP-binding protein n=1 Tax=Anaeromyxobacter paludicola TaxID=2918171 RepID=A0ABM7XBF0_9BACT|nr:ABC transporter ATP-binding protein [Anaeromyxobacter paludicola]BDG09157.1 ABC transporter ATP-binding protein [Anaeromyxobacter paludicola]
MTALLQVSGLEVAYGRILALKGLDLEVAPGELVAVIGSNGAGKTTTLKTISGLLRPAAGEVRFEGRSLAGVAPHAIAALGIAHVPEGRKVFATQTVADNLQLGAYLRLRRGEKRAVAASIASMYETFPRLAERRDQLAGTLSGGEQQMLAIARALVSEPKLLLLDEPSMGLAPVVIDEVMRLVERLKQARQVTILLVEQLAYRALEVADRGYVIEQGRIRLSGPARDLLRDEGVRRAYLGSTAA